MSAPATVQGVGLEVLKDQGIYTLNPSGPQANVVRPADLTSAALCITQALQVCAKHSPAELLTQPGSGYIHAPANITLTAIQGSTTISGFSSWQSWMPGCTIQISGDGQDNELISATQLARPYAGTSGSGIAATVYNDCITLDDTIERIIGPLVLAQSRLVIETTSRNDFIARSAFPMWGGYVGAFPGAQLGYTWAPFWALGPKPTGLFPQVYFLDRYFDSTVAYPSTRLRLSPMPTQAQGIGWVNKMTPIRVTSADIVSGLNTLTVTGATSDTNVNQTYGYVCDVNGYRMFGGETDGPYSIFVHPNAGCYILAAAMDVVDTPAAYWIAGTALYPVGGYSPLGTATGILNVTTSDTGGGAADPGTIINMPNGWVESILLPIARYYGSALPTFKNTEILPRILTNYKEAIQRLEGTIASSEGASTHYV
jgi:hypothetical protein